jgi:hypothetical protein
MEIEGAETLRAFDGDYRTLDSQLGLFDIAHSLAIFFSFHFPRAD